MAVDVSSLATLRAVGGQSFVQQIATLFMNDAPKRAERMHKGAIAGDMEAVERGAHSIRGSCGAFGADHLTELCRHVEGLVRSGQLNQIVKEVSAVVVEVDAVCTALREHLRAVPADFIGEPPRL
ncbi:MAG: Hpt domain-containing protein [Gemmatimonadetes bacterium]|nr:Hpt domain-containing protein [Gemmatimonadota bacterium]